MPFEVVDSFYSKKRRKLRLTLRMDHPIYGPVLAFYRIYHNNIQGAYLYKAYVEEKVIPLTKHHLLLAELKENEFLLNEVKIFSDLFFKNNCMTEEEKLRSAAVNEYQIDYVVVLSTTSTYSNEIKRKGTKLSDVTESKREKHTLYLMVKWKELKDEYELKVSYDSKKGFIVKSTPANNGKPAIGHEQDQHFTRKIVGILGDEVDFLPAYPERLM